MLTAGKSLDFTAPATALKASPDILNWIDRRLEEVEVGDPELDALLELKAALMPLGDL